MQVKRSTGPAMASLQAVKKSPLQIPQKRRHVYTAKLETLTLAEDNFAKDDILLVDISSSGENCTTNVELGDEGTSPAFSSPGRKRFKSLDSLHNPTATSGAVIGSNPKIQLLEQATEPVGAQRGGFRLNSPASSIDNGNSSFPQLSIANQQETHTYELPADFLEPLSPERDIQMDITPPICTPQSLPSANDDCQKRARHVSKQFWKAGDYEGNSVRQQSHAGGMEHVRVHPKFLHSNATSHKWALGAVAELLDNALDEAVNGATFVNVDRISSPRDGSPMLVIEDEGGGMTPDLMRHCMSLGYSVKSKLANTIGQYGNGFKTSTMRLGADVIVFSCSPAQGVSTPTKSIGMLSYTFLTNTGQEDIIVPMVDYEVHTFGFRKLIRSNMDDWNRSMETIKQWSPYVTDTDLLEQLKGMKDHGTRIIVYNLWEDEQRQLELDFDTDRDDIQIKGVNRDQKNIAMAKRFPNSRHFLTYRHSLRSYVSILYLQLPVGFKIILRGKEVEHHSLVNDLMFTQELTYRPHGGAELAQDNTDMKAVVTIGFVKDAKDHIHVQGFNVYHKNRLIKPFWRLWNSSGSHGKGVVGILEANFVEPAHDKQGFERTTVLARLEARLLKMQKTYWFKHCGKVGYYNAYLKKKRKNAKKMKSITRDDLKLKKLLYSLRQNSETTLQRVICVVPARAHARLEGLVQSSPIPWVVTRSLRSKRRRIPARAYRTSAAFSPSTKSKIETVVSSATPLNGDLSLSINTTNGLCSRLATSMKDNNPQQWALLSEVGGLPAKKSYVIERRQTSFGQTDAVDVYNNLGSIAGEIPGEVEEKETKDKSMKLGTQLRSYQVEIERNRMLKAQLLDMQKYFQVLQKRTKTVERERDMVREELEEHKQGELNDKELRRKLKDTQIRVRELETVNRRLQFT